jgi:hypothetical protein
MLDPVDPTGPIHLKLLIVIIDQKPSFHAKRTVGIKGKEETDDMFELPLLLVPKSLQVLSYTT